MQQILGNWTPAQSAELIALVNEQAAKQIEADPQLRMFVDWAIEACGLKPSAGHYRLLFLVSAMMTITGEA